MLGRNRYIAKGGRSLLEKAEKFATGACVFISHQFADSATATEVADELKVLEVDVWLDTEDLASQLASADGDHEKVAEAVEWGLTNCTHLLALISPKTKGSWWVPFEVGSARGRLKPLAFFVRKDVEELPAWLTLGKKLLDQDDFYRWATEISSNKVLTESKATVRKSATSNRLASLLPKYRVG